MAEENSFGEMLRRDRMRLGWTQEELAEKFGDDELSDQVTKLTIGRWERGSYSPLSRNLKKLVAILGLDQKGKDAYYRAAGQAPPEITCAPAADPSSPQIIHLPPRNPFFTGRTAYLERLGRLLKESGNVALTQPVSISGLGGIGKTQLALEYAYRCSLDVYRTVLWVDAATVDTLQASYAAIAHKLKLPERDESDQSRCVEAVKQWLYDNTDWLLVMDNADDLYLARLFLPVSPSGHIVVTTRSQTVSAFGPETRQIDIEAMDPREGVFFLLKRTRKATSEVGIASLAADVYSAAEELGGMLGWHPLALDQAGAYIDEVKIPIARYIDLYREARRRLLATRGPSRSQYIDHPESVVATFEISFTMASVQYPIAMDVLYFFAFLQPDTIPSELLRYDRTFECDAPAFDEAVAALLRYSLIKPNDEEDATFSMHRLVQDVLLDKMPADLQKHWRNRVAEALSAAFTREEFQWVMTRRLRWIDCERLLPHALVVADWSEVELTPTVAVASLFRAAGVYLHERGQYSEAETLLVRVPPLFKQHFGVEHHETAMALNKLADVYVSQGKYDQAEPLFRLALGICEKELSRYVPRTIDPTTTIEIESTIIDYVHPMTLSILQRLVNLYIDQGKVEQAQSLLPRVLSTDKLIRLGLRPAHAAETLRTIAVYLEQQGNYIQAEAYYRDALLQLESDPWIELPATVPVLQRLAALQHRQGKHDQAYALYRRAFYFQKQIGATHPDTQKLKSEYVNFLRDVGRNVEADALEASDEQQE